jgi:hypothetical protein
VTGTRGDGRSYFVYDGPTPRRLDFGASVDDEIRVDDPTNPDPDAVADPAAREVHALVAPASGSKLAVWTFFPEGLDRGTSDEEVAAAFARFDVGDTVFDEGNPGVHTTPTIDYGIVLSGEIDLELDEDTTDAGRRRCAERHAPRVAEPWG